MNIQTNFFVRNAHVIAGVIAALVVPGELGAKLIVGGMVAGGVKAAMITRDAIIADADPKEVSAAQNYNVLDCGIYVAAGMIMLLPMVVNPVVTILVKVALFTAVRRGMYDFEMSTYGKAPFARYSIVFTAKHRAHSREVEFAI